MGLDMYLFARKFTAEYREADQYAAFRALAETVGLPIGGDFSSITLTTSVAYWRKANQVHAWFVDNVQEGDDDCKSYGVSLDQLVELRDLCVSLLSSRDLKEAAEKMPPRSGFFFGDVEIDDYYWEDLENTVVQLDAIIHHPRIDQFDFTYRSSW